MHKLRQWILRLALVAAFAFPASLVAHAQANGTHIKITQVDNSRFPQVTVYVSVIDAAGEPVSVDPTLIQLKENGQEMRPTSVGGGGKGGPGPLTTMLVMDVSGSMDKNGKIDGAKSAATAYVNQMRPGDQTGLMLYNTKVNYVQAPTSSPQTLRDTIAAIKTGGDTSMYDALIAAENALEGASGRKAILVVTDGLDNHSSHSADDVVNGIGPGGLSISAIGLGDATSKAQVGLDETGLTSLAQKAGGAYSFAGDSESLSALFQMYGRALQNEYAITYTSPQTLRDGVNRGLTVGLAGSPLSSQSTYNPGGVLPEVASQSWLLFGLILLALVALLLGPKVIALVTRGVSGGGRRKARIKLLDGEAAPQPSLAKGRVKLR